MIKTSRSSSFSEASEVGKIIGITIGVLAAVAAVVVVLIWKKRKRGKYFYFCMTNRVRQDPGLVFTKAISRHDGSV